MQLALLLNRVTIPIALGIVFFLLASPMAFLLRMTGRCPMARGFDKEKESYRVTSRRVDEWLQQTILMPMLELIRDWWQFIRERKKFWLAPILIVMVLLGVLIVLGQSSVLAPFIYTVLRPNPVVRAAQPALDVLLSRMGLLLGRLWMLGERRNLIEGRDFSHDQPFPPNRASEAPVSLELAAGY